MRHFFWLICSILLFCQGAMADLVWTTESTLYGDGGDDDCDFMSLIRIFGYIGSYDIRTDPDHSALYSNGWNERAYFALRLVTTSELASGTVLYSGYSTQLTQRRSYSTYKTSYTYTINGSFAANQTGAGVYYHYSGPLCPGAPYAISTGNITAIMKYDPGQNVVNVYLNNSLYWTITPPANWSGKVAFIHLGWQQPNSSDGWGYRLYKGSYQDPTPVIPNGSLTISSPLIKPSPSGAETLNWSIW